MRDLVLSGLKKERPALRGVGPAILTLGGSSITFESVQHCEIYFTGLTPFDHLYGRFLTSEIFLPG